MYRRNLDEAAVGIGQMILFTAVGILSCLILASMIQMTESIAQTPEKIAALATREISDKIIIHEIYVWDNFDNYGIIWELSPGSEPKNSDDLHWILQCTDPNGIFWSFWGDFSADQLQDGGAHEFTPKMQENAGLMVEWFDNQGSSNNELPDLANRIPDLITIENNIAFSNGNDGFDSSQVGDLTPTLGNEEFSLRATGYIDIPAAGQYEFELNSDDGSVLWVDGTEVVKMERLQGFTAGSGIVQLEAGLNSISIEYFENTGSEGLELRWQGPATPKQIVPGTVLFHDDNMIDDEGWSTSKNGGALDSLGEEWVFVDRFVPGVIYEMSLDQDNGMNVGDNHPEIADGGGIKGAACGPRQLYENFLEADLTFIVARGGSTWEHIVINDMRPGARIS